MAPAVIAGGLLKPSDFGLRQVFAGPQLGVEKASRRNCSVYGECETGFRWDFAMEISPPRTATVRRILRTDRKLRGARCFRWGPVSADLRFWRGWPGRPQNAELKG